MRTTINLRAGQSLVLAELQDQQESKNVDGVAGLSRLPILGELFKRRRWGGSDAEAYMIVTPTLVGSDTVAPADEALRRYDAAGPDVRPGLRE
jgi:Flp pilus assembly secretin CpaC